MNQRWIIVNQWDHEKQISMKIEAEYNNLHWQKYILKCCPHKGGHSVLVSLC